MNTKNILILIIVLIVLVSGYFLLFPPKQVNHANVELPSDLDNSLDVQIRDMTDVPEEYYSGDSRYSHGECQQDADCSVIGCSSEMCSSDPNLMTTCEILGKTPDKDIYACGCIKDRCGWYRK